MVDGFFCRRTPDDVEVPKVAPARRCYVPQDVRPEHGHRRRVSQLYPVRLVISFVRSFVRSLARPIGDTAYVRGGEEGEEIAGEKKGNTIMKMKNEIKRSRVSRLAYRGGVRTGTLVMYL